MSPSTASFSSVNLVAPDEAQEPVAVGLQEGKGARVAARSPFSLLATAGRGPRPVILRAAEAHGA
eukprot:11162303-Lingulodinium_polyedra.AAC.1